MTMVTMIFTSADERSGPSSLLVADGETKAQLVISEKLLSHRTGHGLIVMVMIIITVMVMVLVMVMVMVIW